MRILITGVTGLLGGALASHLKAKGHEVIGAGRKPPAGWVVHDWVPLDLAQVDGWTGLPVRPDAVIHCAAYIPTNFGDLDQADLCWRVNGLGTLRLLHWAREQGVRRFVYCSSFAVYQRPLPFPVTEDHLTYPATHATPYAMSKLAGEVFTTALRSDYFMAYSLRLSALYGPQMRTLGVVGRFLERARAYQPIGIAAHPNTLLDLVNVQDVFQVIVNSLERPTRHAVYNVGAGFGTTLRQLAEACWQAIHPGSKPKIELSVDDEPPVHTLLDVTRAKVDFDYQPVVDIVAGLREMTKTTI